MLTWLLYSGTIRLLQGHTAKTKHAAVKTATTVKADVPLATSNTGSAPPPNPTKATPYASVVKKTAGGPSGSLTSEGTEYDESSGDEAEETGTAGPQVSDKFPARKQPHQDIKSGKGLPVSHDKPSLPLGQGAVAAIESSGYEKKLPSSSFIAHHSARYQDSPNQLNSPEGHEAMPIMVKRLDSPYLERQIPQSTSSQPEDAWPLIDGDHKEVSMPTCTAVPSPEKTMLYAAAMTNRSNESAMPTTSSAHFPYPSTTVDKAHFAGPSYNQHMTRVTSPPLTLPPRATGLYHPPHPVPQLPAGVPLGDVVHPRLALNASLLNSLPSMASSNQHSLFQSNHLPSSVPPPLQQQTYVVRSYPDHVTTGGGEVYSSAPIPQLGYTNSRPPRNVITATTPLTVAASMTMRNMLGIDSSVQSSKSCVYTTESRGNYQATWDVPTSSEQSTQTPVAECLDQEIQVGVELVAHEVQAQADSSDAATQTRGCYVSVESLAPPEDVPMNSIGKSPHLVPSLIAFPPSRPLPPPPPQPTSSILLCGTASSVCPYSRTTAAVTPPRTSRPLSRRSSSTIRLSC